MVIGIGNDIIEISRIQKACSRAGFLERYFTDRERAMFAERRFSPQTIAGNFAAKEAVAKALGTGFRSMGLSDVEILRTPLGKPEAFLRGNARILAETLGIDRLHVAISHSRDYAAAVVIGEKTNDRSD